MKLKKSANAADNSFARSIDRSLKKKKITLIVLGVIFAIVVALCIGVALHIKNTNRIAKAKSVITQLDINSTFKDAEFTDDGDWDNDGVTNSRELSANTGVQNEDTDGDGLIDGDEIKLGTDPLKADTDGDGLLDGYEIMAGTNPRMSCTDGKTNDAKRELSVTKKDGECTITVTGDANVADTSIEELDLFGISANASIVSKAYDSYSKYKFNSAQIKFDLDDSRITKRGYSYDDLTVLKFDVANTEYTKIDSKVNKADKTITADIHELGTYVVGVEKTVNDPAVTRVCFLIDNSGSMYPRELCETSSENDVEFKRLDFAQSLINKFDSDYQVGICKFTGSYTKMVDFTSDRSELSGALDMIKTESEIFNGTHSQTALKNCINEFKSTADGKYRNIIVMLTDGESDETGASSVSDIAALADDKSVIVLTVGLGVDIDRAWLQEMAGSTGGKYYSASDATALDDVYKQIVTTLNYDIVTYDDSSDGVTGYALYNTGFEPLRNGFSFKNFRTTTTASVDFGMAVFARDWYLGNLKPSLDKIDPSDESEQKVSAEGYDLSGTKVGDAYKDRTQLHSLSTELFDSTYADVTEYLDYDSDGSNLRVKKNYLYDSENRGWVINKQKIDAGNLQWNYVELLNLDIAGGIKKIAGGYSKDDAALASALYRLNALQWDDSADEFNLTDGDDGFDKLCELMSLGVPVVTTIDDTHTVNAIGLIQDSECHRKYILRIYDNNYPDKVKELYIEKTPRCILEINDGEADVKGSSFVYTATYEGKQVGISFSDVSEH